MVNRVTRKNQDLVSELPLTISAQYGLIDQNEFFDKRVASKDVSGYYLIENGEFAYNKSTSTDAPWGAVKRLDHYENGVLSTLYIVFGIKENNPIDSNFLVSYYNTNLWHKGIREIAAEGARNHGLLNIVPADFFETELMIPQDIEEQKQIGKFFKELEALITLHQREFKYVYCRFIINKYKYISDNYICIYTKIYGGVKMNNKLELYHGSGQIVEFPEIRKTRYTKDFSWGFYCTKSYEQACRWAERKHENGIVNVYSYIENSELNIKKFDGMCEEWLDFIAECRAGKTHPYDIVEGPMADDTIWNFVNDYLNKNISKEVFWEYARFKHPSHQISFHSIRALECLKYERSIAVENGTVE